MTGRTEGDDPARPNGPLDGWLEGEGWPGTVLVDHDLTAADAYVAALSGGG